jgi:hypothetical protein
VYDDNGNDVIGQKSMEYFGWRILLRYYAKIADTDNFFKIFKVKTYDIIIQPVWAIQQVSI